MRAMLKLEWRHTGVKVMGAGSGQDLVRLLGTGVVQTLCHLMPGAEREQLETAAAALHEDVLEGLRQAACRIQREE